MMLPNISMDFLNVLFLPLMVMTFIQAWKERRSLWDNELTLRDRFLLQRVVIFLLLPIVVFLHECGHAAATELLGGTIKQFHYAFFWGYVIPHGNFTTLQVLIIYLAGNLVQVCIGLFCLLTALVVVSPPIVALLVYLGLWSAAGTLILYALMSFSGLYGDWIAIYTSPLPEVVMVIGLIHILLVIGLLYLVYGSKPRLWFVRKTAPKWASEEAALKHVLLTEPSGASWLALGWSYYRIGLFKMAQKCLILAQNLDQQLPDLSMLSGALAMQSKKYAQAADDFKFAIADVQLTPESQLRSLLALGDCYVEMQKYTEAEEAYDVALNLEPGCGDTRYLMWTLLAKIGRGKDAESQLLSDVTYWLDPSLKARFEAQRAALSKKAH
jgi:hypothetical protein